MKTLLVELTCPDESSLADIQAAVATLREIQLCEPGSVMGASEYAARTMLVIGILHAMMRRPVSQERLGELIAAATVALGRHAVHNVPQLLEMAELAPEEEAFVRKGLCP